MYVQIWYVYIMYVWYDKEAMSLWRLGRTWREQEDEDGNTIILKYESLNDEWVGKWKASGSSCPPLRTEFLEMRRGGSQPMACISTLKGSPGTACLPFCTSWRHLGTHGAQTPGPRNWKAALLSQHLSSIQTNCCFPRLRGNEQPALWSVHPAPHWLHREGLRQVTKDKKSDIKS